MYILSLVLLLLYSLLSRFCIQPPLWERYQQQLKEWEQNASHGLYAYSVGNQGKVPPEKPPMFAFCLRPRGLEVPNKGSKQRSHRRLPVSGHHHASLADHDSLVFGKIHHFSGSHMDYFFSFVITYIFFFFLHGREKIQWACFRR